MGAELNMTDYPPKQTPMHGGDITSPQLTYNLHEFIRICTYADSVFGYIKRLWNIFFFGDSVKGSSVPIMTAWEIERILEVMEPIHFTRKWCWRPCETFTFLKFLRFLLEWSFAPSWGLIEDEVTPHLKEDVEMIRKIAMNWKFKHQMESAHNGEAPKRALRYDQTKWNKELLCTFLDGVGEDTVKHADTLWHEISRGLEEVSSMEVATAMRGFLRHPLRQAARLYREFYVKHAQGGTRKDFELLAKRLNTSFDCKFQEFGTFLTSMPLHELNNRRFETRVSVAWRDELSWYLTGFRDNRPMKSMRPRLCAYFRKEIFPRLDFPRYVRVWVEQTESFFNWHDGPGSKLLASYPLSELSIKPVTDEKMGSALEVRVIKLVSEDVAESNAQLYRFSGPRTLVDAFAEATRERRLPTGHSSSLLGHTFTGTGKMDRNLDYKMLSDADVRALQIHGEPATTAPFHKESPRATTTPSSPVPTTIEAASRDAAERIILGDNKVITQWTVRELFHIAVPLFGKPAMASTTNYHATFIGMYDAALNMQEEGLTLSTDVVASFSAALRVEAAAAQFCQAAKKFATSVIDKLPTLEPLDAGDLRSQLRLFADDLVYVDRRNILLAIVVMGEDQYTLADAWKVYGNEIRFHQCLNNAIATLAPKQLIPTLMASFDIKGFRVIVRPSLSPDRLVWPPPRNDPLRDEINELQQYLQCDHLMGSGDDSFATMKLLTLDHKRYMFHRVHHVYPRDAQSFRHWVVDRMRPELFENMSFAVNEPPNILARKASSAARTTRITVVCKHLDSLEENHPYDSPTLRDYFHKWGLAMRYCGRVAQISRVSSVREMLFVECIARTCKHLLRQKLRTLGLSEMEKPESQEASAIKVPLVDEHIIERRSREISLGMMNLALGQSVDADLFWEDEIIPHVWTLYSVPALCIQNRDRWVPRVALHYAMQYHMGISCDIILDRNYDTLAPIEYDELGKWQPKSHLSAITDGLVVHKLRTYYAKMEHPNMGYVAANLSASIAASREDDSLFVDALVKLASLAAELKQYEAAKVLALKALEIPREIHAGQTPARIQLMLSTFRIQEDVAIQHYRIAHQVLKSHWGTHPLQIHVCQKLALAYCNDNEYTRSLQAINEAQVIVDEIAGCHMRNVEAKLIQARIRVMRHNAKIEGRRMAECSEDDLALARGDLMAALQMSASIAENPANTVDELVARCNFILCATYLISDHHEGFQTARFIGQKSFDIRTTFFGDRHPLTIQSLLVLADLNEAFAEYAHAIDILQRVYFLGGEVTCSLKDCEILQSHAVKVSFLPLLDENGRLKATAVIERILTIYCNLVMDENDKLQGLQYLCQSENTIRLDTAFESLMRRTPTQPKSKIVEDVMANMQKFHGIQGYIDDLMFHASKVLQAREFLLDLWHYYVKPAHLMYREDTRYGRTPTMQLLAPKTYADRQPTALGFGTTVPFVPDNVTNATVKPVSSWRVSEHVHHS
eukprot:GEMP01002530.1.p1 GENE.GEMP01002530.1~~GEMP01002530.1.p1  ORF type:complete len:1480 (+),score=300.74 GEMP01002530.1:165-4604(+)